jgi:hypothetical protein
MTVPSVSSDGTAAAGDWSFRAPIHVRLRAWIGRGRLDRILAAQELLPPGDVAMLHAARIISRPERDTFAEVLRAYLRDAENRDVTFISSRVPLHRNNVCATEALIVLIVVRLESSGPVTPRGMARLRLLLSEGAGPFYHQGRGDLSERLHDVLAVM